MSTFEAETTIARPAATVWRYAADIERHPDWMSASDAAALRGDGTETGSRGRIRAVFGPFRWEVEFDVVEAVPDRGLRWRADDPRFDVWEVMLALEPIDAASCRARYGGSIRFRGRWRVLGPLVAMEGPAAVRHELGRLKANVESPAAASAT